MSIVLFIKTFKWDHTVFRKVLTEVTESGSQKETYMELKVL